MKLFSLIDDGGSSGCEYKVVRNIFRFDFKLDFGLKLWLKFLLIFLHLSIKIIISISNRIEIRIFKYSCEVFNYNLNLLSTRSFEEEGYM